jgi:amino acid adenylation domain-containing protein
MRSNTPVSTLAIGKSSQFDSEVEALNFTLPEKLHNLAAATAADQASRESLFLLVIFQEVLRRYTGQKSVVIRFSLDEANDGISVLEGNLTLRQVIGQVETAPGAGDGEVGNAALDGEFSFRRIPNLPEGEVRSLTASSIHCAMQSSADGLTGAILFEPKVWSSNAIKSFLSSFEQLLSAALVQLDSPLAELTILSPAEIYILDSWNSTGRPYPRARVDELFEQQAVERPNQTAVTFLGRRVSYASLADQMKWLAARLTNLGVQPGSLVGVCMDRSVEMVVALLGIFRAGAAYLPLDPEFPPDRIEFMLQDARPLVVITQAHLLQRFSFAPARVLSMDDTVPESEQIPAHDSPAQASSLDDVAYVLYTSGSTGKPKGVRIRHRALTNMLAVVCQDVGLGISDVVFATTTISFDISTFEIFAPLITGAHLVIATRSVATNGDLLARSLNENNATVLQATPSGWQVLLESGWAGKADLKMVTAGEPLTRVLAQRLLDRGKVLWNLYGPTETTVYTTGCQIYKETEKITIGRPLANHTAYILDHERQRVPIGAIGELFVGGIGVGAGYLNRPELTADRFLSDPFSGEPEARLYRTGDLARMLPNGEIDLLGRADNQIKLRGYRIELEEVEAVLDGHAGIAKSVARVVRVGDDQRLIAYVIPRDPNLIDEADWRQHALARLPWYMVPTSFMVTESFVLTPNGKVDRKALPAFELPPLRVDGEGLGAPLNILEATVLRCWRTVLENPELGLDDDFFDSGGHSLLAMRMLTKVNKALGWNLPLGLLVEAPTARRFAEIAMQTKNDPPKYLVAMQPEGLLPPVYLVHHLYGDVLIYRDIANRFAPHRPVYGIQPPVDLVSRSQPYSLEELASTYVSEIQKRHTAGAIHLGGFSSGSVIAFEMARQLKGLGYEVGMLGLIDGTIAAPAPQMPAAVRYAKMAHSKLYRIVFKLRNEVARGPRRFVQKRLDYVLLKFRMRALQASPGNMTMFEALMLAECGYQPEPYSGSALLIRFRREGSKFGPDPLMGWSTLIKGEIDVIDVDGDHESGIETSGPRVVAILKQHLEVVEAAGSTIFASSTSAAI